MDKKTIVVVGAGKGMGNHIAEEFGKNDFRIVLMARNQTSLDVYAKELTEKGMETYGIAADASSTDSLTKAFEEVKTKFGGVDVLVYNTCILEGGKPTELSSTELMRHYQVDVASALHSVLQVLPEMRSKKNGTILFTGGGLALYPMPEFTCVSINKAALRALAITLNAELKDEGIFTGVVTIMGNIAPNTQYDPADIAKEYWKLYTERKDAEVVFK
ncbi:SDR family NAD(P)-dependent oxidoreductase [Robinsoniella peoriensis]|uniref:SDR family NAD(P)-dependent oxidoreductase n=1 Tax=Robinsoniella peoriensis TaxID=180332 RepID=UPI00085C7A78|nr:SDR family NAD(P)-dependent oxidoreductase [Robinsoniella peoriensis]